MTPLCCTSGWPVSVRPPLHRDFSSSLEIFIAERIASRKSEWFPCMSHDLRSLQSAVPEVQAKHLELEQRIDALQISAANATTATEHRIDVLQSSTENATQAAASELQRLEDELWKCYGLFNEFAHFSNQQQSLNLGQPWNQQPLFQHSQLPPQHPHQQPPSSSYPPHAPSNNQPPQHFSLQQAPLQAPLFDPSMNQVNPMNAMKPHALAFEFLGRRVERLRKLVGSFSGKPGSGEFPT